MLKTTFAKALSSGVSWRILDVLVTDRLTDSEVGRALGLPHKLVHDQLERLVQSGLLSVDTKSLPSGRETNVYSITRTAKSIGFPPRSYEYLSEALITGLVRSLGEKSAKMILRDIGLKIGESMGETLLSKSGTSKLNPKMYAEFFVKGFLADMNTYPRLVSGGRNELVYERLNCPFQELADKLPRITCDVLDDSVHEGLDRVLGVRTVRLTCKGHGAPTCRFCVIWDSRKKRTNAPKRTLASVLR